VLLVDIRAAVFTFLNSVKDQTDESFRDLLSDQPDQTPVERLWNKMSIDFPGTFLSLLLCYLLHLLLFVIDITRGEVGRAERDVTASNGEFILPGDPTCCSPCLLFTSCCTDRSPSTDRSRT
jgi:hypothetical protein